MIRAQTRNDGQNPEVFCSSCFRPPSMQIINSGFCPQLFLQPGDAGGAQELRDQDCPGRCGCRKMWPCRYRWSRRQATCRLTRGAGRNGIFAHCRPANHALVLAIACRIPLPESLRIFPAPWRGRPFCLRDSAYHWCTIPRNPMCGPNRGRPPDSIGIRCTGCSRSRPRPAHSDRWHVTGQTLVQGGFWQCMQGRGRNRRRTLG